MFKKSQAALEFLTTYAWAFLVILIMVGALAYFGILNPSKLLPERCSFGPEIECADYSLSYGAAGTDGTVDLKLKNNLEESITISDIALSSDTGFSCTNPTFSGNIAPGATDDFAFTACNPKAAVFTQGSKAKIDVTVSYYLSKSTSTYTRDVTGEIYATMG